jgi:hypothetical protein
MCIRTKNKETHVTGSTSLIARYRTPTIERRYRTPLSNAVIERRTSIEHPPISNAANRTPGTIEICDISPSLRPKTLEAKKALVTGQV